jgi:methylmalonyl-CoA mutase
LRKSDVSKRKEIFLGTNKYPDFNETTLQSVDYSKVFPERNQKPEDLVEPVNLFRGSEEIEHLRVNSPELFRKEYGSGKDKVSQ